MFGLKPVGTSPRTMNNVHLETIISPPFQEDVLSNLASVERQQSL
jgi:hypothetical protein